MSLPLVSPNWDVPANVKAFCSTRHGGVSETPWDSLNLALHVDDKTTSVEENRLRLEQTTGLPNPKWLKQTHSTRVIQHSFSSNDADGCYSDRLGQACIVMTADCLPILLCNEEGSWVAAIHAGWRGLADDILFNAVQQYKGSSPLIAWIGPAISEKCFEVGAEVRNSFINKNSQLDRYFNANSHQKWQCDLAGIAECELTRYGVNVHQSNLCTYSDADNFYSHRRATHQFGNTATTGRMASVIWLESL